MKSTKGSISLLTLLFLFYFLAFIDFSLNSINLSNRIESNLKKIKQRNEVENAIFVMVRSGYKKGAYLGQAKYEVKDDILQIVFIGDSRYTVEYDIIEDGSFEWRKKYDSIK